MGIPINTLCYQCLLGKYIGIARDLGDEKTAMAFSKALMSLLQTAEEDADSSILGQRINGLFWQYYGLGADRFREEKRQSNLFVLERMDKLRSTVEAEADPVLAALQFSILGNYIDFAALGKTVDLAALDAMLDTARQIAIDPAVYAAFLADLKLANSFLLLCDNAGEIGFDRLLAEQLQKAFPQLQITFCVRGAPIHNDATREDAQLLQIPFPVIDSGCGIGGTVLRLVSPQCRSALENADVILAKGMGNTETMLGCKLPVYYAFLVKCPRFQQFFQKPHMTPMFMKGPNEKA